MLKIGLLGAGTIGVVHAAAYAGIQGARLVGVVDKRVEAAESLAGHANLPAFASFEELVESENPDIVDICLPTHLHMDTTVKAAELGMHVFCEKPIARSANESQKMIKACRKAGVQLMIGHVARFSPDYLLVHDMVIGGKVGRVGTVRMLREGRMPSSEGDWYSDFAKSGGVVLDLALHDMDWLRWTFGEVERVYAKSLKGSNNTKELGDHCFISLRLKNGAIAHITGSWARPQGNSTFLEVAGQNGVLYTECDEASMPICNLIRSNERVVHSAESPLDVNPYQMEIQHFVDCISRGKTVCVTGEDALQSLKVSLAAIRSIKTGQAITL